VNDSGDLFQEAKTALYVKKILTIACFGELKPITSKTLPLNQFRDIQIEELDVKSNYFPDNINHHYHKVIYCKRNFK
jgi:hypothetical protein